MLHLALDVGGTFTDICLFDDREGATRVAKVSPAELTRRYQEAKIGTFELIRRYGVILDWEPGSCCRRQRKASEPCSNGASCPTGRTVRKRVEERDMDEPRNVPFGELGWTDDAPGIRAREAQVGGKRWATVEYGEGVYREEWCEEGHRGYVISGEIEYEFDDGREPLRASQGEAFLLPPAALGSGAHRGRNTARKPTRLFLIDD